MCTVRQTASRRVGDTSWKFAVRPSAAGSMCRGPGYSRCWSRRAACVRSRTRCRSGGSRCWRSGRRPWWWVAGGVSVGHWAGHSPTMMSTRFTVGRSTLVPLLGVNRISMSGVAGIPRPPQPRRPQCRLAGPASRPSGRYAVTTRSSSARALTPRPIKSCQQRSGPAPNTPERVLTRPRSL